MAEMAEQIKKQREQRRVIDNVQGGSALDASALATITGQRRNSFTGQRRSSLGGDEQAQEDSDSEDDWDGYDVLEEEKDMAAAKRKADKEANKAEKVADKAAEKAAEAFKKLEEDKATGGWA